METLKSTILRENQRFFFQRIYYRTDFVPLSKEKFFSARNVQQIGTSVPQINVNPPSNFEVNQLEITLADKQFSDHAKAVESSSV